MITIDEEQIARFADEMRSMSSIAPFNFCDHGEGILFPRKGQPGALNALFFNAAHQFGFWHLEGDRYVRPMIADAGGAKRKGSDFMFFCTQRALNRRDDFFEPSSLAAMSEQECDAMFHDDHGNNPLPMWPEHLDIMRGYADWFFQNDTTPQALVERANSSPHPLKTFLEILRDIPGYREDPLQKKAMLLAIMMENRPEHFLRVTDPESAVPIIDYHLQRSALRTGLVKVRDTALYEKLCARSLLDESDENAIRNATYEAVRQLVDRSGLSVAAVDYFFFMNRTKCPEMTDPVCAECPVQTICKRETKLFQPVYRTTFY